MRVVFRDSTVLKRVDTQLDLHAAEWFSDHGAVRVLAVERSELTWSVEDGDDPASALAVADLLEPFTRGR